jgi:stringent starvation protein B
MAPAERMPALPAKKEVVLALLEQSTVYIHLDPRSDHVQVPPWFKRQPQLVLQIGLNMPVPIPDLNIDEGGISCTLSFSRQKHFCQLPWSSIYALVGDDGRGMVWPEDIPPEVAAQRQQQQQNERRAHLRAVAPNEAVPAAAVQTENAKSAAPVAVEKGASKGRRKRRRRAAEAKGEQPVQAHGRQPPRIAEGPASPDKPGETKRKRELPPYLRIVK